LNHPPPSGSSLTVSPGTVVDGYRVGRYIGSGSFGSVYEAVDGRTQRSVALKICPTANPEACILRQLDHPHIVGFIDEFIADVGHVTVLEHVSGIPLSRLLEHVHYDSVRKLRVSAVFRQIRDTTASAEAPHAPGDQPAMVLLHSPERFEKFGCRVVLQMATAVAYANSHNIVHRDIKPENILVGLCGTAKLIDFGVGATDSDSSLIGGTLSYMPECELQRLAGLEHELGAASSAGQNGVFADLYALGVVLYEVTVGKLPYPTVMADHSVVSAAREALPGRQGLAAKLRKDSAVEPGIRAIIVNCLTASEAGDPQLMLGYSSARQLTEDLECLLTNHPLKHSCEMPTAVMLRRWRRYRTGLMTAAVFFLVVCLVFLADRHATGVRLSAVEVFLEERSSVDHPIPDEISAKVLRPGWFPDSRELRLKRAELCHGLGAGLLSNGRPEAAVSLLQRAVTLAPQSGDAWNDLGVALFKGKRYSIAIRAFNSAMMLPCDHAAVLSNRGAAYAASNEQQNARSDFLQALRIDEQNKAAKRHLQLLDSIRIGPAQ
jgi:serine/threonine protein kinase